MRIFAKVLATASTLFLLSNEAYGQGRTFARSMKDIFKVDLSREREGVYKVKSTSPVIVGVLARKTGKSRGLLEAGWEGFVPAIVPVAPHLPTHKRP